MNFPVALTSRTRLLLAAVAAIALFAILAGASVGSAAAAGGVSPGDGDGSRTAEGSSKYDRIWNDTSRAQKRWAKRTAECESGGDPDAIGGGGRYRGAFQFMKATWRTSPKSPAAIRSTTRSAPRPWWPSC